MNMQGRSLVRCGLLLDGSQHVMQFEIVEIEQIVILAFERGEELVQKAQSRAAEIFQRGMEIDGMHGNDGGKPALKTASSTLQTLLKPVTFRVEHRLKLDGAIRVQQPGGIKVRRCQAGAVLGDANSAICPGMTRIIVGPIAGSAG